ncbi:hypothetical protein ABT097_10200 [Streptomyces sp. NPDC002225]|uniref:hypothetical protein n=1 Tax=Streptomyces sp. NPDC002225 TaxID=3154413 RepID=UPI00331A8305
MTGPDTTLIVPVKATALAVNDQVRTERFHRVPPDFGALTHATLRQDPLADFAESDTDWKNKKQFNGAYVQWDLPHALTRGRTDLTAPQPDPGRQAGLAHLTYPLVPNRWLVVRYHRLAPGTNPGDTPPSPTCAAWLVHSDYTTTKPTGAPAAGVPYVKDGKPVRLGISRDLEAKGWQPPDTTTARFLTADGCGTPAFTLFQCYNQDVFSLHDPLTAAGKPLAKGTVSYLIAGWYSHAEDDILTATPQGTGPLDALLKFHGLDTDATTPESKAQAGLRLLNWTAPTTPVPTRTLYTGTVLALTWHDDTDSWASARPVNASGQVRVAVGMNTADARDAQRAHDGLPPAERLLRRAFDSARLDILDRSLADHARILEEADHDACFTSRPAGYHWAIAQRPVPDGKGGVRPPTPLTAQQHARLDQLNADQQAYDQTARELADARSRLYDLWWLAGLPSTTEDPDDLDPRSCPPSLRPQLEDQLNRAKAGSLAAQAHALQAQAAQQRSKLPAGDTTAQLTTATADLAKDLQLAEGQRLLRVPHPPYRRAQDPVVLIQGAGSGITLGPGDPLACRFRNQLIDRIDPQPTAVPPAPPGLAAQAKPGDAAGPWQPVTSHQPWAPLLDVLREFNALDQAAYNARRTPGTPAETDVKTWADHHKHLARTATTSTPAWPACDLWAQPWQPLFLYWTLRLRCLPVQPGTTPGWHYDGHHWHLNTTGGTDPQDLQGLTLLAALPSYLVRGRIRDHLRRHPDSDPALLQTLHDTATESQICQSLDGLGAYLTQARAATHWDPPDKPVDLKGLAAPHFAVPSPTSDATGKSLSAWGSAASGAQFRFTDLVVVDRFGRAYDHINPQTSPTTTITRSTALTPNTAHAAGHNPRADYHQGTLLVFDPASPDSCAQYQPRLQQDARALIELVSPTDDHLVLSSEAAPTPANTPDHGPVCGWIVPDHTGTTLTVYAADGTALGELAATGPHSKRRLDWCPLPGCPFLTVQDLHSTTFTDQHPHLGPLIQHLFTDDPAQDSSSLTQLCKVIDQALLSTAAPDDTHTTAFTLLTGRPVAVVRARLRIELADAPHPQPAWERLLKGPDPADGNPLRTTAWPIRLGDTAKPHDGMIGYYTAPTGQPTDYSGLYSPYRSRKDNRDRDDYTRSLTPEAFPTVTAENTPHGGRPAPGAAAWVTMLVDPFTTLHAHTGILPTATTRVPDDAVRGPLARIALNIPTGPVLATRARPSTAPDKHDITAPDALALPAPGSWHGTWTWWERTQPSDSPDTPDKWTHLDIGHTDTLIHPPDTVPDARTGYLTLTRPTSTEPEGDQ